MIRLSPAAYLTQLSIASGLPPLAWLTMTAVEWQTARRLRKVS